MTHNEQKKSPDWDAKKHVIKTRDNFTCQRCGEKESEKMELNVHHKCYRLGKKLWEYNDDELITLCWDCHWYETEFVEIPIYNPDGKFVGNMFECFNCDGTGRLKKFSHNHNGFCFKCHGIGYDRKVPLRVILDPKKIWRVKNTLEKKHKKE